VIFTAHLFIVYVK